MLKDKKTTTGGINPSSGRCKGECLDKQCKGLAKNGEKIVLRQFKNKSSNNFFENTN